MNKFLIAIILGFVFLISCNETKNNKMAEYSGEDISGNVEIIRDKNTKAASLKINIEGEWKLYTGNNVENINFTNPILSGNGSGTFPINVTDTARSYFEIETEKGKAILAERHLPMAGGYNFRDLGGYKTTDGKYVKWGKIFRSDELHNLTTADLQYLSSIPLVSVVDFRSTEEIQQAPDVNPKSVKENYPYSISPGNLAEAASSMNLSDIQGGKVDSLMMELNELLVTDSAAIKKYIDFFALLQNEEKVPLMFHCSAGKDRTGMGAALTLLSLGVDEETVMNDYLLSNKYLDDKYGKYKEEYPALAPLFGVKEQFIKAGLDRIKKDHGSVENYLKNVLKVDIDKMREMYLY